jgi:quercetin dioxygenase-like cupin family protein
MSATIPAAQALRLLDLIAPTDRGIASRVLAKTAGCNVTLFAFDAGEGLTEHTTSYDALALVLDGAMTFTIGGNAVAADAGTIVRLPASVPHAVDTTAASRMLLIMLKEAPARQSV